MAASTFAKCEFLQLTYRRKRVSSSKLEFLLPQCGEVFLVIYGDSWLDTAVPPIAESIYKSASSL
jgi:hypothetical protein